MIDIGAGLVQIKRAEPADGRNPLAQLFLFGCRQFLHQLRLPGQNDLHQLGVSGFEVRKLTQSFQHREIEVLGFVNDHNYAFAFFCRTPQQLVDLLGQFTHRRIFRTCSQFVQQ